MSKKLLLLILVPVLAVGGPPLAFKAYGWFKEYREKVPTVSLPGGSNVPLAGIMGKDGPAGADGSPEVPPLPAIDPKLRFEGQAPLPLADVFRFDITTGWILARWPRVTTGLAELQLQGYRVPLVSGTQPDDIAGALTYYFGPRQQVERITFQGTTGDVRKLVQYLATEHRFSRRLTNDPGLFRFEVARAFGSARSYLEIRPADVLKADDPHHRFALSLVIERPE